jgi:hypothetical protein
MWGRRMGPITRLRLPYLLVVEVHRSVCGHVGQCTGELKCWILVFLALRASVTCRGVVSQNNLSSAMVHETVGACKHAWVGSCVNRLRRLWGDVCVCVCVCVRACPWMSTQAGLHVRGTTPHSLYNAPSLHSPFGAADTGKAKKITPAKGGGGLGR